MARASASVPMWGVACSMWSSTMTAKTAFGLIATLWGLLGHLTLSFLLAQCSEMVIATMCIALLTFCRTFGVGMGVTTLLKVMFGHCGQCI